MKHCYLCHKPNYRAGEPIFYSGDICECVKPNFDNPKAMALATQAWNSAPRSKE